MYIINLNIQRFAESDVSICDLSIYNSKFI